MKLYVVVNEKLEPLGVYEGDESGAQRAVEIMYPDGRVMVQEQRGGPYVEVTKPKVLVVDDEEPIRRALRRVLRDTFCVLEAGTVREALRLLPHVGVVCTDWNLGPHETALEVVKAAESRGVRCIVLTGAMEPPEGLGVVVREKPVQFAELMQLLQGSP